MIVSNVCVSSCVQRHVHTRACLHACMHAWIMLRVIIIDCIMLTIIISNFVYYPVTVYREAISITRISSYDY